MFPFRLLLPPPTPHVQQAILEAIAMRTPEGGGGGGGGVGEGGGRRSAERRSESLDRLTRDILNLPLHDTSEF